jgi:hypothetical protein
MVFKAASFMPVKCWQKDGFVRAMHELVIDVLNYRFLSKKLLTEVGKVIA